MLHVCTVDLGPLHFEIFSDTGGAKCKLFVLAESGVELKITSVSEKNFRDTVGKSKAILFH